MRFHQISTRQDSPGAQPLRQMRSVRLRRDVSRANSCGVSGAQTKSKPLGMVSEQFLALARRAPPPR